MSSWRKVENENGFPFYINESENIKQWDHPKYNDVKQRLDDCNYIKYASYRVASKFRVLQHALCMNDVPLTIIAGVFEKHRLGATEGSLCLESYDLEAVLSDIYFAANKQAHTNTDIDFATELMMTFLYNMFDKSRRTNIEVSSAKITLALLSDCKIQELHRFLFSLCADHNNCVTRLRLQSILSKICAITVYLKENVCFGPHLVHAALEQCFNNNPGLVGIGENTFLTWLNLVPQLFAWLPVLRRLQLSETVLHHGKCSVCKLSPVMGLRYTCLKCRRYVQCQRCFLTGRTNRSHKLSHTMREHCREDTNRWTVGCFTDRLCGLIKCSYGVRDGCLMDVNIIDTKTLSGANKDILLKPLVADDISRQIEPLSSPLSQLQVIIKQLELQNRELQQMMVLGMRSDKEVKRCFEEYRIHVESQIEKLKVLKNHINPCPVTPVAPPFNPLASTPMVYNGHTLPRKLKPLDLLSPITPLPELNETNKLKPPTFALDLTTKEASDAQDSLVMPYSLQDISTWIGGHPTSSSKNFNTTTDDHILSNMNAPVETDLDDALAKLQQILANNFSLDESLGNMDNCHLKNAVTEVEGMLSSIIDNVESNKAVPNKETECLLIGA